MSANYAELVAAGEVWVGLEDRRVTGVLVIRPTEGELLLENVAVVPARQGRGHGRALISFAEGRARELGLEAAVLYTNEAMAENLALYPRLGYVETERRVEHGYRRVLFRKSVVPEDAVSPAAIAIGRGGATE